MSRYIQKRTAYTHDVCLNLQSARGIKGMSGLTEKHKAMIERLFEMDKGKVLGFDSNRDFKNWILLESEIDIEKGEGYSEKGSKAKKFRYFIENEPEVVVGKVLLGMLNK